MKSRIGKLGYPEVQMAQAVKGKVFSFNGEVPQPVRKALKKAHVPLVENAIMHELVDDVRSFCMQRRRE